MESNANAYAELAGAIRRRLDVVADHGLRDRDAANHLSALRAAADEVDACIAGLPADAPVHLRHYLENQSYGKALDFLEGRTADKGLHRH